MKSGKFLFIAMIFLVSLLCISAVSAADDASSDVIADTNDGNVLDSSINDAGLADSEIDELEESDEIALADAETTQKDDSSPGTFTDLDNDINGNDNTEITLTRDYKYAEGDNYEDGVNITRNLTIDGNGHRINANHQARVFHVYDDYVVTFKNIVFVNGWTAYYGYGGGIWAGTSSVAINCTFINNYAHYGGAISRVDSYNCTFMFNNARIDSNAYLGSINDGTFINSITLGVSDLTTKYNSGDKLLFNLTGKTSDDKEIILDDGYTTIKIYKDDEEIATYYTYSGDGWVVDLDVGVYTATLSVEHADSVTATITVEPADSSLSAAAVTTTYNVSKDLVITLKDAYGNPLSGVQITVDLDGAKEYTTDENGQVKIAVGSLVPNTYTAKISFAGNENYTASEATAKVTVQKATPKLTAKAKTFKFEDKTKKYTITLKDKNGKALKNTKVSLKVNGKTYTAKTNSKGVATFKLSKLTKEGAYNAVITYAGDKYYNKVSKKAKITVKEPYWKTVAKGSKDKAMVKKIQIALKKNRYYLSFKGRYLKVDGLFHKYTEMAVKEFQRDKGLKVTGKVDRQTAKKLKLI